MEHYCFDIIFPEDLIDFTSPTEDDGSYKFHAHLYANESSIELRIYFGCNLITPAFSTWLNKRKLEKALSKCEVINIIKDNRTHKIDLSGSTIIGQSFGGNQYENGLGEYLKVKLSSVKIYHDRSEDTQNSADFYLNSVGFDLVKDFYSVLFGYNGEFKFSRIDGRDLFYEFENIEFRPEFDFLYSDNRNEVKAIIEKKPKIRFIFPSKTKEKEIIHCAELVRLLGSFYMHNNIEYNFSRIHLETSTLLIYKSKGKEYQQTQTGIQYFGLNWDFHELMMSDWQNSAKDNYKLLSKIIPLFVQSMLVDHHSSLLIRYNIIEYCMGKFKTEKENFPLVLSENEVEEKYKSAYNLFLETIDSNYHVQFMEKWKYQLNKLKLRPEKSLWTEFLTSENIFLPSTFSVEKIKQIRDSITHGSLNRVKETDIIRANSLMYGVTGLLILHRINIHEGNFDLIIDRLNKNELA